MKKYLTMGSELLGVTTDHGDYLPACWEVDGHPDMCNTVCEIELAQWICTREAGHEGDHAAHGGGPMLARWPQKEVEP